MEEPLPHGRVVAVAHGGDHVPAVVAQVLHGLLARDVPLVREEDHEDEEEDADHDPDRETLERRLLEGVEARVGHACACRLLIIRVRRG